jgi:dihydrofolate reductase
LNSIIVAAALNNAIGGSNDLLWRIPEDLKRFKALTMGKMCLMGRKTFESIGKALPGRRFVIISRDVNYQVADCTVVQSLEAALALSKNEAEVMIIGGGEIYRQALPFTDKIYLTRVMADFEGDTYFPELAANEWHETEKSEVFETTAGLKYQFIDLERV